MLVFVVLLKVVKGLCLWGYLQWVFLKTLLNWSFRTSREINSFIMHPARWLLKNGTILFYSETYISLNISMAGIQSTFMYQLRVSRGLHDLFFRTFTCWTCLKHLVNLAKYINLYFMSFWDTTQRKKKKKCNIKKAIQIALGVLFTKHSLKVG